MTIKGTEVADVHAIKDVLLMRDGALDGIRQALDTMLAVIVQQALAVQPARSLELNPVICLVGVQVQQILTHTAYGTVYRHVVIV